jgi:hypothetical protein
MMVRGVMVAAALMVLAGCAEERRVLVDNSPSAKFAALFGGQTDTSDGPSSGMWQVQRGDGPGDKRPVSAQALRIAELLKQRAANPSAPPPSLADPGYNTGGWNITTNFQTSNDPATVQTPASPANGTGGAWGTGGGGGAANPVTGGAPVIPPGVQGR